VAIVQISRIQNRRGRELTDTGIPQLASGEIGWAVDTQKMYIGNGSVSEGAPAVGNTEILTENSNLFGLADKYTYKPTSNLWGSLSQPKLSLQSKLDQMTTAFDFGVKGDGATDDTAALQNAIDSLYLRGLDENDRAALHLPAGDYLINGTIYLPPFVSLIGDGVDKTIIRSSTIDTNQNVLFATVPGSVSPGSYNWTTSDLVAIDSPGENQARHIYISDMTIQMNRLAACFKLDNVSRSVFRNLRMEGAWLDNIGTRNEDANQSWFDYWAGQSGVGEAGNHAFVFENQRSAANCKENIFENIQITKFYDGIVDETRTNVSTRNRFTNIDMSYMIRGIKFGDVSDNQDDGPSHNIIENSTFDKISQEGILVDYGDYNISRGNRFYSVGNGNDGASFGGPSVPVNEVIKFTSNYTNISTDDYFERTQVVAGQRTDTGQTDQAVGRSYVPEVGGKTDTRLGYRQQQSIGYTLTNREDPPGSSTYVVTETIDFLKIPLYTTDSTIEIDYVYVGKRENGIDTNIFIRKSGKMTIEIHKDDGADVITFYDDGNFTGDSIYDAYPEFGSRIDNLGNTISGNDAVVITCKNLTPIEEDTFTYSIRVKSS